MNMALKLALLIFLCDIIIILMSYDVVLFIMNGNFVFYNIVMRFKFPPLGSRVCVCMRMRMRMRVGTVTTS